jgi:4-alpha-glucanotransferase
MPLARASGVLLHPTSLPGGHGIGDLGPSAAAFVAFLAAARQQYWQVLPLGPTGYGDSPYQSFSAFAGNPLLIDLLGLVARGWLDEEALVGAPAGGGPVDYGTVVTFKQRMLRLAYAGFQIKAGANDRDAFASFCRTQASWLEDFALFMALKDSHGGACWNQWEKPLATRQKTALSAAAKKHRDVIGYYQFSQWMFFKQWSDLRAKAAAQGVKMIGDLPIFVAFDSADAWANKELFYLDADGNPTVVAGVPPDYFSETGQLWGNPLYRWDVMAKKKYAWWIERVRQALSLYDLIRIDHFRGFEAYWEVPAAETTAIKGRWVKGPEGKLFKALQKALGNDLPIIAEDLGVITPEVEAIRDGFGLPGMKILQFAWSEPSNAYLPHNFVPNCVVYTGTHDNDTTRGWFDAASPEESAYALSYMQTDEPGFTWAMIRLAMSSVAALAVVPVQDLLDLGGEARMNLPSTASGNWAWRVTPGQLALGALTPDIAERLAVLTHMFGRTPESAKTKLPHSGVPPEAQLA